MEIEGEGTGEASPACDRDWAELQPDLLMLIFQKVGLMEVLSSAESVCRSWRKVAKDEPDLWRKIDMSDQGHGQGIAGFPKLMGIAQLSIDRSMGRLEEFSVGPFADLHLLRYLCDRTSVLKKLRMISCWQLFDEAIAQTAKRQPLLEEIQFTFGYCHPEWAETVGKECPQLKSFKFNCVTPFNSDSYNDIALGIARTMHQLCHLQLVGNRLTNWGLKAILDGCPHLETLDVRKCLFVNMDANMQACCAKLKTIRLPGDHVDDNEFEAYVDRASSPDLTDPCDYSYEYEDLVNFNYHNANYDNISIGSAKDGYELLGMF